MRLTPTGTIQFLYLFSPSVPFPPLCVVHRTDHPAEGLQTAHILLSSSLNSAGMLKIQLDTDLCPRYLILKLSGHQIGRKETF